jgi:2-oxoglutarate ferredoxin oxidoreductase subunit alpha
MLIPIPFPFSVVSSSTSSLTSHYLKADLVIVLDKRSYKIHQNHVKKRGYLIYNSDTVKGNGIGISISEISEDYEQSDLIKGVTGIAAMASIIGMEKKQLDSIIKKEYTHSTKDNIDFAHRIYDQVDTNIPRKITLHHGDKKKPVIMGNEAIALGAAAAGLDLYYAYPMTPSTSILHFYAKHGDDLGIIAVQPENEIAVANMAIGSSFTGARTMVGTSGGGFCLMQEAFSLAGMLEAPVLFCLSQRPGPSTGVPTYTEQADLLYSLHPGHGEFPRIVACPGSIEEAFYLTAELLNLVWTFQTPGILLTEKHLSESGMTVDIKPYNTSWVKPHISTSNNFKRYKNTETGISPLLFPPSEQLIKWNSYEHDIYGNTTENAEDISQMHVKREKKQHSLIDYLKKQVKTINIYGDGGPVIFTFGSTTMSVLEALDYAGISATVVQLIYFEPFPEWDLKGYKGQKAIIIEQNSTGQLEQLLQDRLQIDPVLSLRQFNGRPFDPIELGNKIRQVV